MLRRDAETLRVFTFGGAGMQARVETLYQQWKQIESSVPWEITSLDHLVELPFEERNERMTETLLNQEADILIYHMPEASFEHHGALHLAAITKPDNIMDFLCVRKGEVAEEFSETLRHIERIGQLSARRETQLRRLTPNIQTVKAPRSFKARLQQIKEGAFDAMLVSAMQLPRDFSAAEEGLWFLPMSIENILPAVGQGSLGMMCRLTDPKLSQRLTEVFDHEGARRTFEAERSILLRLGQDNSQNMTAHAEIRDGRFFMRAINAAGGLDYFKCVADYLSYDENYRIKPDRLAAYSDRLLGHVTFLGAGPNDSELMTHAAIERVKDADFVVMDRTVGDHIYRWIGCDASVIYIDEKDEKILLDNRASVSLRRETRLKIIDILLDLAREGKTVLRVYSDESLAVGAYEDESSFLREEQVPCDWLPALASHHRQRIDHAYKPLSGRKFILTRPVPEASIAGESPSDDLADFLRSLGAQMLETPLFRSVSNPDTEYNVDRTVSRFLAMIQANGKDREGIVILSTKRDVRGFFKSLKRLEVDIRSLMDVRFLVPNSNVGQSLLDHGIQADYVSSSGLLELEEYCQERLTKDSQVLWSHMQPLGENTFGSPDGSPDMQLEGFDGVLPPRVYHFDQNLNTTGANINTIMPYKLERVRLCNHRQRHLLFNTTDIVIFSPLEVRYFMDLLENSQLTTPEKFFDSHHVFATTAYIARLLRGHGCDKVIELNLADKDMLYDAFTEIDSIEETIKQSL